MFDAFLAQLADRTSMVTQRPEGVAFFRAAKDLYRLGSLTYLCVNIPVPARAQHFAHCLYSDSAIRHCASSRPINIDFVSAAASDADPTGGEATARPSSTTLAGDAAHLETQRRLLFSLRQRLGETAVFGIRAEMDELEWDRQRTTLVRELRILANYFHGHILRIHGNDSEPEILVSARELDCLKWTAAGKTAWEASVILGISERTVRFHLNAAREKLNCTTTTQAVAKAIANQLIDV